MNLPLKVRLTQVHGDQEDFADLIGNNGTLKKTAPADTKDGKLTFVPDNRGDWLTLAVTRKSLKDGIITVKTALGNTFVFKVIT